MSDDLREFIKDIQLRNASKGRPWFWEKNAHRSKPIAYALEYNPLTLALKTRRYISRRRMLAPLMAFELGDRGDRSPPAVRHLLPLAARGLPVGITSGGHGRRA